MFNPFKKIKDLLIKKSVEKSLHPLEEPLKNLLKRSKTMKGYRTLLINAALVGVTAILTFVAGLDLKDYGIDGTVAVVIMAVVNFFMRIVTNTSVGRSDG